MFNLIKLNQTKPNMKKSLLMLLFVAIGSWAWAQTGSVTGRVVDPDTDEALIGANVILKGTTKGTTTDLDGVFKIGELPVGQTVLVVTFVGYEDLEITANISNGQTRLLIDKDVWMSGWFYVGN